MVKQLTLVAFLVSDPALMSPGCIGLKARPLYALLRVNYQRLTPSAVHTGMSPRAYSHMLQRLPAHRMWLCYCDVAKVGMGMN